MTDITKFVKISSIFDTKEIFYCHLSQNKKKNLFCNLYISATIEPILIYKNPMSRKISQFLIGNNIIVFSKWSELKRREAHKWASCWCILWKNQCISRKRSNFWNMVMGRKIVCFDPFNQYPSWTGPIRPSPIRP